MAGVESGYRGIGMLFSGTLNTGINAEEGDHFYDAAQNFIGGALSVYAGMGKVVKGKFALFKQGEGVNTLVSFENSNGFTNLIKKNGDAFLKYGVQASAYDFSYTKREDYAKRTLGQHVGIFVTGGSMGAVADHFFIDDFRGMNDYWRSAIGAGSFSAEWFISARIKNLPKDGFKWESRNKAWILTIKWLEQTAKIFVP